MALVKFESKAGNLIMIHDYADQILKMIGHSGVIPSALLPTDIETAIKSLEQNLAKKEISDSASQDANDNDYRPSLKSRVYPFKQLLKRAQQKKCGLVWNLMS